MKIIHGIVALTLTSLAACQSSTPWNAKNDLERAPRIVALEHSINHSQVQPPIEEDLDEYTTPLPQNGSLKISIEHAVVMALRNNRELQVRQLTPAIEGTFEELARSVFDPRLTAETFIFRERSSQVSRDIIDVFSVEGQDTFTKLGVSQLFPTGTEIELGLSHERSYSNRSPNQHGMRAGVSLTQALLHGADYRANIAQIQQAELQTQISEYELRGFAELLVAEVETAYWNYVLAQRNIEILENSVELARRSLDHTQQRIDVGALARTELSFAQAELASRMQDLIDARSHAQTLRLQLLQRMNPLGGDIWDITIEPLDAPAVIQLFEDPVDDHVELALTMRPEINETRARLEQGRLEVVQTRNGLLPQLDLFIRYGKTGYAGSFGDSIRDFDSPNHDLFVGARFEYLLTNRAARARHQAASVSKEQQKFSLLNLAQLIEMDVRMAYVELERAYQQIEASERTRQYFEEAARAEEEKFRVGASTALLVAQAQRDLLESQLNEIEAIIQYRLALIELYRLDGSLLRRRAIQAPGDDRLVE